MDSPASTGPKTKGAGSWNVPPPRSRIAGGEGPLRDAATARLSVLQGALTDVHGLESSPLSASAKYVAAADAVKGNVWFAGCKNERLPRFSCAIPVVLGLVKLQSSARRRASNTARRGLSERRRCERNIQKTLIGGAKRRHLRYKNVGGRGRIAE